MSITDLLDVISKDHKVAVVYTKGGWLDIDNITDYTKAEGF